MSRQASYVTKRLLAPQVMTTTTTGSFIDLQGAINPGVDNIKIAVDITTVAGTTPSVTFNVQECANTTVASATNVANGTFAAITTNQANPTELQIKTNLRYILLVATFTANTTSANIGAVALLENRLT